MNSASALTTKFAFWLVMTDLAMRLRLPELLYNFIYFTPVLLPGSFENHLSAGLADRSVLTINIHCPTDPL
jgi:hypothetical protein